MTNVRFTAYISHREKAAIDSAAERESTSANFIVRQAIRQFLQIDNETTRLLHVTNSNAGKVAK